MKRGSSNTAAQMTAGDMSRTSMDSIAIWLRQADRIVVFTGAGLSKASGIPTYRDSGGL